MGILVIGNGINRSGVARTARKGPGLWRRAIAALQASRLAAADREIARFAARHPEYADKVRLNEAQAWKSAVDALPF